MNSSSPDFEKTNPENLGQRSNRTADQRWVSRLGRVGGVLPALLVAACVQAEEGPSTLFSLPKPPNEGFIIPKPVVVTPPTFNQTFELWLQLPPKPTEGNYLKAYTLVAGDGYTWSLEVQDKTGVGRPMFSGVVSNWNDWINYHLASRMVGGGVSSIDLLPGTDYHLLARSGTRDNLCVLELVVDGKPVDLNERWNGDDPKNCTIPVSHFGAQVGRPPAGLGGIAGHNFPGKVLGFRNSQ